MVVSNDIINCLNFSFIPSCLNEAQTLSSNIHIGSDSLYSMYLRQATKTISICSLDQQPQARSMVVITHYTCLILYYWTLLEILPSYSIMNYFIDISRMLNAGLLISGAFDLWMVSPIHSVIACKGLFRESFRRNCWIICRKQGRYEDFGLSWHHMG